MASAADKMATAAARGEVNLVREMLDAGVNPNETNSQGRTPIQVMMMGSSQMARLLIAHGANPAIPDPSTGTCPAHDAAREGFVDTLLVFLHGGASLFYPLDNYQQRPIDLAPPSVIRELRLRGVPVVTDD